MDEKKKKGGFFGKLFKYFGLFILIIVAIAGIGVAGAWMTGKFDPEKIYIQQLTIKGEKEYVTITENDTSYTTQVDFLPAEANQLTLTSRIVTGGSLIEPLGTVVAGQPFELKFVKDDQGITKGGEVEIKFVDSAQKAYATLKVLIDVALDSQYIDITSNGAEMESQGTNTLSTKVLTAVLEENKHTIKISTIDGYDEMLNSYKGNWSPSEKNSAVSIDKLKKMLVSYEKDHISVNSFDISEVKGEENYYLIKYLTPATIEDFELDLYFYRTYFLESVFEESFALDLIKAYRDCNYDRTSFNYDALNTFINNYVYHNSSVDAKNIYDTFSVNGVVVMDPTKYNKNSEKFIKAIENTLDYALVHKKILISVDKVEIKNIINLNNNAELKFPVLQSVEYSIDDVYNKLGVSLVGVEDTTDRQVLFNTLRDIDIKLCYQTDIDDYNAECDDEDDIVEKLKVIGKHYKVGEKYLRIADQTKFSIVKTMNDDGSATWKVESLSPTASSDHYYLLFAYEKNDFETSQKLIDASTGAQKEYNYIEQDGVKAWYYASDLETDLDTLAKLNNRKYACTPISVTFTNGSIQYNAGKVGGVNVVNNLDTTTVVLNAENSIYKNNSEGEKIRIKHGDEGGVYYKGREMSVGIRTNESDVLSDIVVVSPENISATMEYTYVKWFVSYFDNVVGGADKGFANNNKYYFKPVVNTKYDDSGETKQNEIPTPYKLKNISDNGYIIDTQGQPMYFMEVGCNNFTLEALNAMPSETPIALYAVIIQTNIDNTPYIAEQGEITGHEGLDFVTLNYISQTNSHTVSTAQLVESLDFYFINNEDNKWINCTTEENGKAQYNFLDIQQEATQILYLTNFILDENGEISELSTDWLDQSNKVVMKDAVDLEGNKMIALKRYYDDFIAENHVGIWSEYDGTLQYGAVVPTNITYDYNAEDTHKHKIKVNIENKNASLSANLYPFTLSIQTESNPLRQKFYTEVATMGYFQLSKTVAS